MFQYLHRAKLEKGKYPSRFSINNSYTPKLQYSIPQSNSFLDKLIITEIHYEHPLLVLCTDKGLIHCFNTEISALITISLFSTNTKSAKSITVNKHMNTLVIVYVNKRNTIQELKCEEISLKTINDFLYGNNVNGNGLIREIQYEDFTTLFEREVFISPAFIEFDEINSIILTKNSLGTFKVWSMKNYKANFELTDKRIEEVRLSEDILMTIMTTSIIHKIILFIHSIHNGKILYKFEVDLIRQASLIFLELFSNVLFMKQEGHIPLFIDLLNLNCNFLNEDFNEDAYFIYINKRKMVIAFNVNEILFYDLEGKLLNRIRTENAIDAISPSDFSISYNKRYMATYWRLDGRIMTDEEVFRRKSKTNSDLSIISLSQESRRGLKEGNISNRNDFKCSLSSIKQASQISKQSSTMKNEFIYQESINNKLDVYCLDSCANNNANDNCAKPIAAIQLRKDMEISGLVFDSSSMVTYFITVYGDIFLINL